MDFDIPKEIKNYLTELDAFIEKEIKPLEDKDDNIRFFDHRREDARTDWDRDGLPSEDWESLLKEMRIKADQAGHLRFGLPKEFGGKDVNDITNLIESLHFITSADTSKVGLFGISRGGMMNYLTLKRKINKIKAVVSIGAITDMNTTIKYHPRIDGVCEELIPNYLDNKAVARNKRSVTNWVDKLPKTPMLILHGMKDQHVDYSQIPPFLDSLEKYHVPFKSMSFENDNHGIKKHREFISLEILKWFERYLKREEVFKEEKIREIID